MLSEKELKVIANLRQNSRESLTKISRRTGMPVSSIFEKLKRYKGDFIVKHTSLLDFNKIGFNVIVNSFIKIGKGQKKELFNYLVNSFYVNNITAISNKYDVFIETAFKSLKDLRCFNDELVQFGIENKEDFYVIEYLKREGFLSDSNNVNFAK